MFVYRDTIAGFREDVEKNQIGAIVQSYYENVTGRCVSPNERRSWDNSLQYMERIVRRANLAPSCGVLIEYIIPSTSNRIDFFVSGHDEKGNKNFVIVELKQWETAEATEKEDLVSTFLGKAIRDTTHPSYQALSYKLFLQDHNESIDSQELTPYSCAYLHNFIERNPEPLITGIYTDIVKEAPIYFRDDHEKLESFLKKYVGKGDGEQILYEVESGRIRPSKKLIDHVTGMFEGNKEFILLDEQKVAYETARYVANQTQEKSVIIISGGPGTGKSVVSVNLLGGLLKDELNTIFVAPNASFRDAMIHKLAQKHKKTRLKSLFQGSSAFVDTEPNIFDAIVVDEAHRLKNEKAYMYQGENQVEDIVRAAKTSIFFIDDNQIIRPDDIGSEDEIRRVAKAEGARIYEVELKAQFRCSGAEGYLNWLDNTFHIQETANFDGWESGDFEFKIFDSPVDLAEAIKKKQKEGKSARLVAGYAWEWTSAKEGNMDAQHNDVTIPEYDFSMPWNSRRIGTTWAIDTGGEHQIGCVHTSQGLEFDYIGVIVGKDLQYNPETKEFFTEWSEYRDRSGKKGLREDPEKLNRLVRNIYKILMTRGQKGCYIYFRDNEVKKFFKQRLTVS